METQKTSFNLKLVPWSDWGFWIRLLQLIFPAQDYQQLYQREGGLCLRDLFRQARLDDEAYYSNLQQALRTLVNWLKRNVGGADHIKALKMQKLLIIEMLADFRHEKAQQSEGLTTSERCMASNYRLIQLVELGAKTVQYKKSKQGGKLAMRDIAEQHGLPQFLVQLRHQAVHEAQPVSRETMRVAVGRLQQYLFDSYWYPIIARLSKRDLQLQQVRSQLEKFSLSKSPPNVDAILSKAGQQSEKAARSELKAVLTKYTKSHVKLTIPLDVNQLADIVKMFVDCSLAHIKVRFVNLKGLSGLVSRFEGEPELPELMEFVESTMKQAKNILVCFLSALQRRHGEELVPSLIFQRIIYLLTCQVKQALLAEGELSSALSSKDRIESAIKLVALFSLVDRYSLLAPLPAEMFVAQEEEAEAGSEQHSESGEESEESSSSSSSAEEVKKQPRGTSLCSFQLLLLQFESLRFSFASLEALKQVDFFANYLFRKFKLPNKRHGDGVFLEPRDPSFMIGQQLHLLPEGAARVGQQPENEAIDDATTAPDLREAAITDKQIMAEW